MGNRLAPGRNIKRRVDTKDAEDRCKKVVHRSRHSAVVHAQNLTAKKGVEASVYRCCYCPFWHITTHPHPKRKANPFDGFIDALLEKQRG